MIATCLPGENVDPQESPSSSPPLGVVASAVAGVLAGWIAAGSTGLLADPFRHALGWMLVAVAVVATRPGRHTLAWLCLVVIPIVVLPILLPTQPAHDVLGVALVLAVLARNKDGLARRILLLAAVAVGVLGVLRLACTSIPTAWMLSGALGMGLGRLAQAVTGRPLCISAAFGGLDFLVVMGVLYAGWLRWTEPPRAARAVYAAVAILVGHLLYLMVLSFSTEMIAALPELPPPPSLDVADYRPPAWNWSAALRKLIPWNVPMVAAIIQAGVAALMFRWASWQPIEPKDGATADSDVRKKSWLDPLPVGLAVATAVCLTLSSGRSDLTGKTIVAHREGHVNWSPPEHDHFDPRWAHAHGLLPEFVSSLGGEMLLSPDLSEADLAKTDVLLLVHPTEPWTPKQLERIEAFVRDGGSLLVVAGPAVQEKTIRGAVDAVLKPTGMRIRYDVAVPATEQWRDACLALAHPATLGLDNRRGDFGLRSSSSIRTRWPARPILVGRWGWSDPGGDATQGGTSRFESGEKLGDLILAAERPLGRGTVVALADGSCLNNLTNAAAYRFTGRLLSYLARRPSSPQAWWRQILGLLACGGLAWWMIRRADTDRLMLVVLVLAVSLAFSTTASCRLARVLPEGRADASTAIAYVDASHLEAYNDEPWSNDGIDGLMLTLMRNGHLPLKLPELTAERLDRAAMLVSIAPSRAFSAKERGVVQEFVERGGVFVLSAGATESKASQALLAQFEFNVRPSPVGPGASEPEPEPLGSYPEQYGRFTTVYLNATDYGLGDYQARVWCFSGWPVDCHATDAEILVRGHDNVPLAIRRPVGKGSVVVIGDTGFALNHNLGYYDGRMVEGVYANGDFWRWLFSRVHEGAEWIPPDRDTRSDTSTEAASDAQEASDREATP